MKFQIISDSSLDLPEETVQKMGIEVVPFYVSFDGSQYFREGKDIKIQEFYRHMVEHPDIFPKTSMPSYNDYRDVMEKYAAAGQPVLCICLNAIFSGSYQTAYSVREELLERYPDTRIEVMDSQLATVLQGLLVEEAVKMRDLDYDLDKTISLLEPLRATGQIFFTTNDLAYLRHGGRIGHAASSIGTVLKIKPLIRYKERDLYSAGLCRGRKHSLEQVLERMVNYVKEKHLDMSRYHMGIAYGWDEQEFDPFKEKAFSMMEALGYPRSAWEVSRVGVTIGVHTGPSPIGVGWLKRYTPGKM